MVLYFGSHLVILGLHTIKLSLNINFINLTPKSSSLQNVIYVCPSVCPSIMLICLSVRKINGFVISLSVWRSYLPSAPWISYTCIGCNAQQRLAKHTLCPHWYNIAQILNSLSSVHPAHSSLLHSLNLRARERERERENVLKLQSYKSFHLEIFLLYPQHAIMDC